MCIYRVYKCVYKYDGFTRTLRVDPQRCGRVPPSRDRETIGKGACREGEAVLVGVGHLRKKGGRKEAERVRIHRKMDFYICNRGRDKCERRCCALVLTALSVDMDTNSVFFP